tara:strand:- start:3873 stop:4340 length:468 start_codon:yes stop_codon:yes gene_type:complete
VSIFLLNGIVKPEWTDYNKHMNLAFYIHLFDSAWETVLKKFNMGENSAIKEKKTTFAVESHTTYDGEVREGDEIEMTLLYLDHDKKRLLYKLAMHHKLKKYLAATTEVCSLYVDLNLRKVTNIEDEKINRINNFILENKNNFNPGNLCLNHKLKK